MINVIILYYVTGKEDFDSSTLGFQDFYGKHHNVITIIIFMVTI